MKALIAVTLVLLSGCSWMHGRKPPPPDQPELIITGAPQSAIVLIDGVQVGEAVESAHKPLEITVAAGEHLVEIKVRDAIVYRETTYAAAGDRRIVTVLSGATRD